MARIGCVLCCAKYRIKGQNLFKIPNSLNRYVFETDELFWKHLKETHGLLITGKKVKDKLEKRDEKTDH